MTSLPPAEQDILPSGEPAASANKSPLAAANPLRAWLPVLLAGFLILNLSLIALAGASRIPFHPDESTQLFMSADFDLLFADPLAMAFDPALDTGPQNVAYWRQLYRKLDAPLTRYLLGLGRTLAGLPALPADWDWGKSYAENRAAGALPAPELLLAGRVMVTLLLPLSCILLYLSGAAIGGRWSGLLAILFLGLNALVWLHARRAMAEGALLFGVCFALWGFQQGDRRPWLAGLGMALAFNAKQSTLALFPVGLLAVIWLAQGAGAEAGDSIENSSDRAHLRRMVINALVYCAVFALLTLALNPLLWRNPLAATRQVWEARQDLSLRQLNDARLLAPQQVLDTPAERVVILLSNLYLTPPSFYEVGNYREQTRESEQIYILNPLHNLGRNPFGAAIFLGLGLAGIAIASLRLASKKYRYHSATRANRRGLALLLLASIFQFTALVAAVSLSWQRYVLPLVPMACLWAAYTIGTIGHTSKTGEYQRV